MPALAKCLLKSSSLYSSKSEINGFMNNEISGISVSEEIIEQYKDISKEEASKLAVKISTEIVKEIESYVDGYYLLHHLKESILFLRSLII